MQCLIGVVLELSELVLAQVKRSLLRGYGFIPKVSGMRKKIFLIFEDPQASRLSTITFAGVITTIIVSTVAFVVETLPECQIKPDDCDVLAITETVQIEVLCVTS